MVQGLFLIKENHIENVGVHAPAFFCFVPIMKKSKEKAAVDTIGDILIKSFRSSIFEKTKIYHVGGNADGVYD